MSAADRDPRRAVGAELLSTSPVTLFHRVPVLQQALRRLRDSGYHVVELDAGAWRSGREMHADLARGLDFPAYYGSNLDAFNDCLGDVTGRAYGFPEDATGLVLALTGFDGFATGLPGLAHGLLDVIAVRSRGALLSGEQLICLIQSADPRFSTAPVGATPVVWNPAEWHDGLRGG